jgi:hypothetical protein
MSLLLLLIIPFYLGGVVATAGHMFAGTVGNADLKHATVKDYLYLLSACLLWPGFIIQEITTKDN